ncbi:peptidase family S58-domain-containing protein [Xylogone sp. PMI_703]|nr:peptidase family S58-domain-containing protein [Xylogone sp. PMI_703]
MRVRDIGYSPGQLTTGPKNSILDVPDVHVGQTTIHEGDAVHTGVTVILPRKPQDLPKSCYAGLHELNGMGEMTASHQVQEVGYLNAPIALTNTLSVGKVYDALFLWEIEQAQARGEDEFGMFRNIGLPVVCETLDIVLNDISRSAVEKHHVYAAIDQAINAPEVLEGSHGGGTGMRCHGFKGGIGTSSRLVKGTDGKEYTVGVICQANYGYMRDLRIGGVPIGRLLIKEATEKAKEEEKVQNEPKGKANEGSCIVIIATDAPFLPHQLRRLAQRATVGLSQVTGHGVGRTFSGEIFLAFSTANTPNDLLTDPAGPGYHPLAESFETKSIKNESIDTFFYAVAEATEESILNAMVAAKDGLTGWKGRRAEGLPVERVRELLEQYYVPL